MRAPLSFLAPGLIGVFSTFTVAALASAQAPAEHDHSGREQYHVEARRASRPPAIDGVLDEPVWGGAAMLDTFTQQEPNDGAPATERTEVRLLYDVEQRSTSASVRSTRTPTASSPRRCAAIRRRCSRKTTSRSFSTPSTIAVGYMFVTSALGAKLEQQISKRVRAGVRHRDAART